MEKYNCFRFLPLWSVCVKLFLDAICAVWTTLLLFVLGAEGNVSSVWWSTGVSQIVDSVLFGQKNNSFSKKFYTSAAKP